MFQYAIEDENLKARKRRYEGGEEYLKGGDEVHVRNRAQPATVLYFLSHQTQLPVTATNPTVALTCNSSSAGDGDEEQTPDLHFFSSNPASIGAP
ncbi:hypothetical protein L1987_01572 [Smallanthus sonchifolius]|uniref:Uncharacterized protein n=1 Tax=Smallanthus sonchifolius TaxID=185202 RepID=A0ACB9K5E5_9ASTR|nr:hypothetical protein L1987_01572 [Smallanthus sonchifolius]